MAKRIRKNWLLITVLITTVIFTVGASMWLIINESNFEINAPITKLNPHIQPLTADSLFEGESLSRANFCIARPSSSNTSKELTGEYFYRLSDQEEWQSFTTISAKFGSAHTAELKPITYQIRFVPTGIYAHLYNEATSTNILNVKAVAYVGSNYYGNIPDAVTAANTAASSGTATSVVVIPDLAKPLNVSQSITLNSKVSMYVPFKTTVTNGNHTGTGTYHIEKDDNRIKELYQVALADKDATAVTTNRATLINLTNGADISISADANLYLGGEFGSKGVAGKYCEINLDSDSSITCAGYFLCNGYVKENASTAKNGRQTAYSGFYDNSYDSERFVKVLSGGSIKSALAVYDMQAASGLKSLNDAGVFPLNQFDFPNMQTYVEIEAGATFEAHGQLVATTSKTNIAISESATIVTENSNTTKSLFYLTTGSVGFEYCPNDVSYTNTKALTRIFINGGVTQGTISLNISDFTISTEEVFLPISHKLNVFVCDGAEFSSGYKIKFLPGALLKILKSGSAVFNNKVIFYESADSSKISLYSGTYSDAVLINNGTIMLDNSGAIAAFIQTESTDGTATLDFSSVADSAAFTVTAPENSTDSITHTAQGYFEDNSEEGRSLYQFMPGATNHSATSDLCCWAGQKYGVNTLSISIAQTAYTYNVLGYQVYTATDANGNGQIELTSGLTSASGSHHVISGQYVKIVDNRCASINLNGQSYSMGWYEVTSDLQVVITPNEGVLITIQTRSSSGNGDTTFTVFESATKSGSFSEVDEFKITKQTGKTDDVGPIVYETICIVKNWWFKIDYTSALGSTSIKTITIYNEDGSSAGSYKKNSAQQATQNYTVDFNRDGSCIAAGTLITLADGSQKKVEDLLETDVLLVFDHETGKYVAAPILFIERDGWANYNVINLEFSNGTKTKLIYEHALFDLTLNKYIYITESNYSDYVGHKFAVMNAQQSGYDTVTLTKAYVATEYTGCYSLVTAYHLNYFIDGLFSIPGGITGLFNYFEYDKDLKYDEEKMQADIAKYGLYTYEDFKDYVSYEVFEYAFAAKYFKVSVGKGLMTYEDILALIERYVKGHDLN